MIYLYLYGKLRNLASNKKVHQVHNCNNIGGIVRYLISNFPKLKSLLNSQNTKDSIAVLLNGKSLTPEELRLAYFFKGDELKLVPFIHGQGDRTGKIIAGIILIIVAVIILWLTDGTLGWEWLGTGWGMVAGAAFSAGVNLIISGLTASIMAPANYDNSLKEVALKTSYGFGNNADNLSKQGNPVPIGYGTMRVGSQVIGAGLSAANI